MSKGKIFNMLHDESSSTLRSMFDEAIKDIDMQMLCSQIRYVLTLREAGIFFGKGTHD